MLNFQHSKTLILFLMAIFWFTSTGSLCRAQAGNQPSQDQPSQVPPAQDQPAQNQPGPDEAAPPGPVDAPPPSYSPQQLDDMVSRIALYPDSLLAQVFGCGNIS